MAEDEWVVKHTAPPDISCVIHELQYIVCSV